MKYKHAQLKSIELTAKPASRSQPAPPAGLNTQNVAPNTAATHPSMAALPYQLVLSSGADNIPAHKAASPPAIQSPAELPKVAPRTYTAPRREPHLTTKRSSSPPSRAMSAQEAQP